MGKKRAKKQAKGGSPKLELPEFTYTPLNLTDLGYQPPEYIRLMLCGGTLSHLDFAYPLTETSISLFQARYVSVLGILIHSFCVLCICLICVLKNV